MADSAVVNDVSPERALRSALAAYPTGVVAVSALVDGAPVGMALNSFTSISLNPALVAISVARTSTTWPLLVDVPRLGLSVLGADHAALGRQLSARTGDRFAGVSWESTDRGAVLINGSALWIEASLYDTCNGGDHEIVLLKVEGTHLFDGVAPLIFHQSTFRHIENDS